MRPIFLCLFISLIVPLANCGGTSSDNPPNIQGFYQCKAGCSSVCLFPTFVEVQQDGDEILVLADFGTARGNINNNGDFNFSTTDLTCEGEVFNQQLVANCSVDGTQCQEVAYLRVE